MGVVQVIKSFHKSEINTHRLESDTVVCVSHKLKTNWLSLSEGDDWSGLG